jgi:hypothetical protein
LPGTLEFAIHTLVETRLDTSGLVPRYRHDETERTEECYLQLVDPNLRETMRLLEDFTSVADEPFIPAIICLTISGVINF